MKGHEIYSLIFDYRGYLYNVLNVLLALVA